MKETIKIEVYEGDPFRGCCGPGLASTSEAERLRNTLMERNRIVKRLLDELKDKVEVGREIIGRRGNHPSPIRNLLAEGLPLPYTFINGEVVSVGKFPSLEEFQALLKPYLKK